jgi:hypothetical protein
MVQWKLISSILTFIFSRYSAGTITAAFSPQQSVCITRQKGGEANSTSHTIEEFVPPLLLQGLLPQFLLDHFFFWWQRSEPSDSSSSNLIIIGEPRCEWPGQKAASATSGISLDFTLRLYLVRDASSQKGWSCRIEQISTEAGQSLILLNLMQLQSHSCRTLQNVVTALCALEDASHCLFWARSAPVAVSSNADFKFERIDLPRLGLTFDVVHAGSIFYFIILLQLFIIIIVIILLLLLLLFCCFYCLNSLTFLSADFRLVLREQAGYFLELQPSSTLTILRGIPNYVVLRNDDGDQLVLMPSVPLRRPRVFWFVTY